MRWNFLAVFAFEASVFHIFWIDHARGWSQQSFWLTLVSKASLRRDRHLRWTRITHVWSRVSTQQVRTAKPRWKVKLRHPLDKPRSTVLSSGEVRQLKKSQLGRQELEQEQTRR